MDYEKYDTVEAVEAYVNGLPHAAKTVLDVPWRSGRRIDRDKVQFILDSYKKCLEPSITESEVVGPSNLAILAPSAPPVAAPCAAPCADEGHILIPFSEVKKWIPLQ
jgi:hypothetical protein